MPENAATPATEPNLTEDRRELARRVVRRFIVLAVPVLLVAALGLKLTLDRYEAGRFEVVASREAGYLRAVEVVVQQELDEVLADMDTLVSALALHAWSVDPESLKILPALFITYGEENQRYDQIRLLDMAGVERLRVNFRDGRTEVVPPEQLQDKAHRPYFEAMSALKAGERYLSPMELNMERGRIEHPPNPTIRFGAPVFSRDGEKVGVLVINYRAEKMESRLRAFAGVGNPVDSLLINGRGEVLLDGASGLADWLLRANASDVRLGTLHPDWWDAIEKGDDFGRLMTKDGLMLYHWIRPLQADNTYHGNTLLGAAKNFQWTAVRFIPADALFENSFVGSWPGRIALITMFCAMAGLIFVAAWLVEREQSGRRQRVRWLEAREAELGALIDAAPSGILEVDDKGTVLRVNRELSDMLGYRQDELIGERVEKLIPERIQGHHPSLRQGYFEHPVPRKMAEDTPEQKLVARHKDGREIPVAVNLNMFSSGGNSRAIATVSDVTRQRAFEADLQAARDHAQEASAAKSAFLALMSHEIRTPLNAIVGMSYLMGRSTLTEAQRNDLDAIQSSGKALLALINDVLDFSRIEAGELLIEARDFRLADLLREMGTMFRGIAADKGIALEFDPLPADIPETLTQDPGRLHQILVNLISNAIKFTSAGHVRLQVTCCEGPHADPRIRLRFSVSDTGIGIAPERQARLFDPFVQADSSTSRKFGGSGLGLSIVKRLTELMGGELGCESALGAGARFWVELPFGIAEAGTPMVRDTPGTSDAVHVLIVESGGGATPLKPLCASLDWHVDTVSSAEARASGVCERLRRARVDCVLINDPAAVADVVGQMREHRIEVPVLAIGGAPHAPCARLAPPLSAALLFNAVNDLIEAAGGTMGHLSYDSTLPDDSLGLVGLRVLAVDDSRMNLEVVARLLEIHGAEATCCVSGEAALRRVREADTPFDAILMDLQMPGMDGFETARNLIADDPDGCAPIIALSAGVTRKEVDQAREAGMVEYLTKPVDPQVLIRVIRRCVEMARGHAVALVEAEAAKPPQPLARGDWPRIAGIDDALSRALMSGDEDFYATVLASFVRHAGRVPAALAQAMDAGDLASASRIVHKLRGQAGNVGATDLQHDAGAVEDQLNRSALEDGALAALNAHLHRVCDAIGAWLATREHHSEEKTIS